MDDVDGVFSTQLLVYHIQLERFGAIVEGRPGHGNGRPYTQLAFSEGRNVFASLLALYLSLCCKMKFSQMNLHLVSLHGTVFQIHGNNTLLQMPQNLHNQEKNGMLVVSCIDCVFMFLDWKVQKSEHIQAHAPFTSTLQCFGTRK